jgi:small GTP-binding protein
MYLSQTNWYLKKQLDPTIEDTYIKQLHIDSVPVMLHITDTANLGEYDFMIRDHYIRCGEIILIVYSVTDRNSFEEVNRLFELVKRTKDYIEEDKILPIALIGNKIDLVDERVVSYEEGRNFAKDCGVPIFMECSAKTNENIDQIFVEFTRYCRKTHPYVYESNKCHLM